MAKGWWLISVILVTWEAEIGRIVVQGQPRKHFVRLRLQNNENKMNCRCGSRVEQVQSPEFKTQSHTPPKKREEKNEIRDKK
jgi:hypothetical protein